MKQKLYRFIEFYRFSKTEQYNAIPCMDIKEDIYTLNHLLSCKCGNRKIASCNCPKDDKRCKDEFYFQCAYCNEIEIPKDTISLKDIKIAVVQGKYDDIGSILTRMGLKWKKAMGKVECDMLFLNCGCIFNDTIWLIDFVQKGGILYVSDLASSVLLRAFPGLFTYDNKTSATKRNAVVVDPELEQIINGTIQIEYDLGAWVRIHETTGKVILKDDLDGYPIMISKKIGKGTVFYTSFHNHKVASEKEKMLLELLLLKQISTQTNKSVADISKLVGLNLDIMKDKFKK